MSQQLPEEWFVQDERINATVAWALTAVFVGIALLAFLNGLLVSMAVALVAAIVAVVPPLVGGTWTRTVSWPLLLVAAIPLAVGATAPTFFRVVVVGSSVATLGMLVVVALQLTTTVRMTPAFAVFFVTLATLATAGWWAVGSAVSARYLGTRFVQTNDELMLVFTAAAIGGIVAGLLFRWYFRRLLARESDALTEEAVA